MERTLATARAFSNNVGMKESFINVVMYSEYPGTPLNPTLAR